MTQLAYAAEALVEPRPEAPALTGTVLTLAGLRGLDAGQWDGLAAAALVENPFYSRGHLLAALETIDRNKPLRALAIRIGTGELVGLFPFQPRSKVPFPLPVANSASGDYLLSGMPLVHRDHAAAVIGTWLDLVASGKAPGLWSFADLDMGSPIAELMLDGALTRHLATLTVHAYGRAFLTRLEGGFEAHLEQVLSKNRLKDVRRTMRRLEEAGKLELEHVERPAEVGQRLEDFLAVEHSGWKGEQGTSLLSRAGDAAFARLAYGGQPAGFAGLDSLLLDGKPIAMKLSIRAGRTAFTPKIAYDEAFKKLGPGMALEYMLIEEFYRSTTLDAVDAAATAEGHSALNFFNGEKPMATLLVGRHAWQVRLLAKAHGLREAIKHRVKALQKA